MDATETPTDGRKRRGFASMSMDERRRISALGGKKAHAKGTAHRFTREEAKQAGSKGGRIAHALGTAHEFTSEEAIAASRKAKAK
jgi:hypothetical protein